MKGEREGSTEAAVGAACDQDGARRIRHRSVDGTMGVDGIVERWSWGSFSLFSTSNRGGMEDQIEVVGFDACIALAGGKGRL